MSHLRSAINGTKTQQKEIRNTFYVVLGLTKCSTGLQTAYKEEVQLEVSQSDSIPNTYDCETLPQFLARHRNYKVEEEQF
eukprot:1907627-Heterocapsa_arctica.AAC.1